MAAKEKQLALEQELMAAIKEGTDNDESLVANNVGGVTPSITESGWTDYILSQMDDNELLIKKNKGGQEQARYPKVNGLRRILSKYLGRIVKSAPTPINVTFEPETKSYISTFLYTIIYIPHTASEDSQVTIEYTDVGETLYSENGGLSNIDKKFGKYPSALAVTRGEARALRKALCLNVVAAEEFDKEVPDEKESSEIQLIKPIQKTQIEMRCKQFGIDVLKYLGKYNYTSFDVVTYGDAASMWKELDSWQRDKKKLDEMKKSLSN